MPTGAIRPAAVAGQWYSADADALGRQVAVYLESTSAPLLGELTAIIAPHAGLMYSGPVAAYAYRQLIDRAVELVVLAGPSHFIDFEGTAIDPHASFATPLGPASVDRDACDAIAAAGARISIAERPHAREHSLEMQLPFVRVVAPRASIVPLVMGRQTRAAVDDLAQALEIGLRGRRAVLVASTDLSHYESAPAAAALDARVMACVEAFDADALMSLLEARSDHACGGGPAVAVMRAARARGAEHARVLHYADSGDVSGDKTAVVGYLAAAFGRFE